MKELVRGMKVRCTKRGVIGKVVKAGGRSSKVRIPIFDTGGSVITQIPNKNLARRL